MENTLLIVALQSTSTAFLIYILLNINYPEKSCISVPHSGDNYSLFLLAYDLEPHISLSRSPLESDTLDHNLAGITLVPDVPIG